MDYIRKKWGLSVLVDEDLLFDTFCSGEYLKTGFQKYNVDIHAIKHVVISHEHWDHTGGLWYILEHNNDVNVYLCSRFSNAFRKRVKNYSCTVHEVIKPVPIKENIYSSGEMEGRYSEKSIYEQSLIVKKDNKIAVITGCSHPGILNILSQVISIHNEKINLLLGGLHLINKSMEDILEISSDIENIYNIEQIAPFHCTSHRAIKYLKKNLSPGLITIHAGDSFDFNNELSSWEWNKKNKIN